MNQRQIPSNTVQILTVTKFELKKSLRQRKIYGVMGVTLLLVTLFVILPEIYDTFSFLDEDPRTYAAGKVVHLLYLIAITAVIVGSSSLSTEFRDKTGYALFSQSVLRTSIWFGKFFASVIIIFSVIITYYVIVAIDIALKFDTVPVELVWSFLFALLVCTTVMSVVFLFSSLFKSTAITVVTTLVLLLMALPALGLYLHAIDVTQDGLLSIVLTLAAQSIVTVLSPDTSIIPLGIMTGVMPMFSLSALVFCGYIVGCSMVSIIIFKRKDM